MKRPRDAAKLRAWMNWRTAKTPLGTATLTERGFEIIQFDDRYKTPCTLQQSSIFDPEYADFPGATAVWLGVDRQDAPHDGTFDAANLTRMHLDRAQVHKLIAVLEMWIETGHFAEDPPTSRTGSAEKTLSGLQAQKEGK